MIKYVPSKITTNPYSDVVVADNCLYLSGLVSEDIDTGEPLPGNIEWETDIILNNMAKILEENGSGMDRVIRVEVFLRDYRDIEKMNHTYIKHFPQGKLPSRICVQVSNLYDQCKLEIMAIAHI